MSDRAGKILWQRTSNYDDLLSAEERAKLAEEGPAYAAQQQKVDEAQKAVDAKQQEVKKRKMLRRPLPMTARWRIK